MKGGTAVANVIDFAKKALQSGEHRTIVWTGYGGGVGKTISCAEILKRDFTLHQVTRLCYKTYALKLTYMLVDVEYIGRTSNSLCNNSGAEVLHPPHKYSQGIRCQWHIRILFEFRCFFGVEMKNSGTQ